MAGVDDDYGGQVIRQDGKTVGFLPQEPVLDESLTVRENIEQDLAHIRAILDEYEKVNEGFGDPEADFDALIAKHGAAARPDRRHQCVGASTAPSRLR